MYLICISFWDDESLTISQSRNRTLQLGLRQSTLKKWVLTGNLWWATWWNLFQESQQMERQMSSGGCWGGIWRKPRWNFSHNFSWRKGVGWVVHAWTETSYSAPELIITLPEILDQPKSPSEARLHRRIFPGNISKVPSNQCKDDN